MSSSPLSPEELVCRMSRDERIELLDQLGMEATAEMADRIKTLTETLGSLERAIDAARRPPQRDAA